jgi:thiamine biosynthesis lipoprotein
MDHQKMTCRNWSTRYRQHFFVVAILFVFFGNPPSLLAQSRFEFSHPQMGTLFQIIVFGKDSILVKKAVNAAFARIDSLNAHLSDYLENSEISRLPKIATKKWIQVSSDMWNLLSASQLISQQSNGAFDITIGPLSKLWRRAFRQQVFPNKDEIQSVKAKVNYPWLKMRQTGRQVRLTQPDMRLDAGGIAKGFAVDEATSVLGQHGFEKTLVIGGGDLRVGAAPPGKSGWTIGTKTMSSTGELKDTIITLVNAAVSTSGDTYRYLEWQGEKYSHIIDPRTGLGINHRGLTRIQAPTSTLADVLATTINVLGPEKGLLWAKKHYPQCIVDFWIPKD